MVCSLTRDQLFHYVRAQLDHFFPDGYPLDGKDVRIAFDLALERSENCFKAISIHGYHDAEGNVKFSHLHGDQYATFLYYFGNSLWRQSENAPLCEKLLQLNRALFSLFISFRCNMPDVFLLNHPIGTVLGNASYNDYLVVLQGVTVNTAPDPDTAHRPRLDHLGRSLPILGKGVFLAAGATILGGQPIGDRVSIGANVTIYEQEIPDDSVVIPQADGILIRRRKRAVCRAQECFNVPI